MIGLAQYIEPTIQFLLAVFLFNELFDWVKGISFSLIWIGLMFCVLAIYANSILNFLTKNALLGAINTIRLNNNYYYQSIMKFFYSVFP